MSSKTNGANVGAVYKGGSLLPSLAGRASPPKRKPYGYQDPDDDNTANASGKTRKHPK